MAAKRRGTVTGRLAGTETSPNIAESRAVSGKAFAAETSDVFKCDDTPALGRTKENAGSTGRTSPVSGSAIAKRSAATQRRCRYAAEAERSRRAPREAAAAINAICQVAF